MILYNPNVDLVNDNVYESFYKNEGICEGKKQKNNIAYFDSFSFKTELLTFNNNNPFVYTREFQ